jgi:hypothetical protein
MLGGRSMLREAQNVTFELYLFNYTSQCSTVYIRNPDTLKNSDSKSSLAIILTLLFLTLEPPFTLH